MLLNKSVVDGVSGFKLVSGEEVIAKVVEETDTTFVLSKPLTLMPSQQGLGMMQSLISMNTDANTTLYKSAVMFTFSVMGDIESHYIQTTSGIALAR